MGTRAHSCLSPPRLFRERLSQLRVRLEEVGAERAPEYTEPLGGLQRSLKIRIQVAGLWPVLCPVPLREPTALCPLPLSPVPCLAGLCGQPGPWPSRAAHHPPSAGIYKGFCLDVIRNKYECELQGAKQHLEVNMGAPGGEEVAARLAQLSRHAFCRVRSCCCTTRCRASCRSGSRGWRRTARAWTSAPVRPVAAWRPCASSARSPSGPRLPCLHGGGCKRTRSVLTVGTDGKQTGKGPAWCLAGGPLPPCCFQNGGIILTRAPAVATVCPFTQGTGEGGTNDLTP